jgi:YHS domain-containing protein
MFSLLLRIFSLVFILWLLRRILAAVLGGPKPERPGSETTKSAPEMVKDPVCGMYGFRLAVRMEDRKEIVYFCSEECKKKYINGSPSRNYIRYCRLEPSSRI